MNRATIILGIRRANGVYNQQLNIFTLDFVTQDDKIDTAMMLANININDHVRIEWVDPATHAQMAVNRVVIAVNPQTRTITLQ